MPLRNDGGGGFLGRDCLSTGTFPRQVATGDFDGNGSPDLVVTDSGDNALSVLMAGKTLTPTTPPPYSPPAKARG